MPAFGSGAADSRARYDFLNRRICNALPRKLAAGLVLAARITPEVSRAVDKLTRAGIPVGNQSVLLAGVNDCVHIMRKLVHKLVENRIRPYYIYQCDPISGSSHFRTPVSKGLEIIQGLRGHTTGYAVPTYVIDAPGGGGAAKVGSAHRKNNSLLYQVRFNAGGLTAGEAVSGAIVAVAKRTMILETVDLDSRR